MENPITCKQAYCLNCDFSRHSLTEYRIISLGSTHQTATGHTVVYEDIQVSAEELVHLLDCSAYDPK